MILWYVLPHNVIGKTVKQFGSILFSFGFIARTFPWNLVQSFFKKRVFSRIFNFLEFFAKPKFSYMIIYAKTHNFVSHKFLGWLRCVKSSLTHLILKAHLQVEPKVYKWQSCMGLMYWTYILRIWEKPAEPVILFLNSIKLQEKATYINIK